jgi:8-oxo-dGTP pyrophosphatase MutT (NUDIX family)
MRARRSRRVRNNPRVPSTPRTEFSAGGVVVRGDRCVVIVPTRRAADGSRVLALPKGHPEAGESAAQAAQREVREEAGVAADVVEKLGDVRYFYMRNGRRIAKRVAFFLLAYREGDPDRHDHEVEEARWMDLGEAARRLTYKGEREMAALALSRARTA